MTIFSVGLISVMLIPVCIANPSSLVNIFFASFATCSSTAERNSGIASRIVTSDPSLRQTLAISRPITPAPIIPNLFGASASSSAPSLSRTHLLSINKDGNWRGAEPVAIITCFASTISSLSPF